jgi:hypothetical protein
MGGSQSAPIMTPPRRQIHKPAEYFEPVYGWGPAAMLKHNGALFSLLTVAKNIELVLRKISRAATADGRDHRQ